jgi:hypothetical protein
MDFTGKPLKSMIYVDAAGIDSDTSLERWVLTAERVARALPNKIGKAGVMSGKARKSEKP